MARRGESAPRALRALAVDAFLRRTLTHASRPAARLYGRVAEDPRVALVVDECGPVSGRVRQVVARGTAELLPCDVPRGRRKLSRYPGEGESRWDRRFLDHLYADPERSGTVRLHVVPASLHARDLGCQVG
ncbi:phosphate oxidase [Streptomyces sp. NHF165]|nr:phosphate oxidase [Streptomyces sp. NHF165]